MRHLLVLSLVVAAGCTEPTATVSVGWSLEGGTCKDLGVYKGGGGLVDQKGTSIGGGCLACENAFLEIEDVPFGTYTLHVTAMNDNLVVIGSAESTVKVGETEDGYVHASAKVRVDAP